MLTYQSALLFHYRSKVAEDIVQLVYTALDVPDLRFALGDERFLEL